MRELEGDADFRRLWQQTQLVTFGRDPHLHLCNHHGQLSTISLLIASIGPYTVTHLGRPVPYCGPRTLGPPGSTVHTAMSPSRLFATEPAPSAVDRPTCRAPARACPRAQPIRSQTVRATSRTPGGEPEMETGPAGITGRWLNIRNEQPGARSQTCGVPGNPHRVHHPVEFPRDAASPPPPDGHSPQCGCSTFAHRSAGRPES